MLMKDQLIGFGLSGGQAEQVIKSLKDEINGNYIPKVRFNQVNEKRKKLQEEIRERDSQMIHLLKLLYRYKKIHEQIKEQLEDSLDALTLAETNQTDKKLGKKQDELLLNLCEILLRNSSK